MNKLSIVMYHYVRDLKKSRYPEIKGLSFELFKEQIDFLKKNYTILSAYDLFDSLRTGSNLPSNAALLTFDDGYLDHFQYVFPVLDKKKLSACFFPPVKCIMDRKLLSVNKIHFILASVSDKKRLVDYICQSIDSAEPKLGLPKSEFLLNKLAKPSRFDTADVIFIKRTLQRDLPEEFRDTLVDNLFHKFVTIDEIAFAQEVYMTMEQVECLQRNGMYVGSHGYDHYWLNTLSPFKLEHEIDRSLEFLKEIGSSTREWIMCYPYGAYNEDVISLLKTKHCTLAVTTEPRIALWKQDDRLTLPRLDTNDILEIQRTE